MSPPVRVRTSSRYLPRLMRPMMGFSQPRRACSSASTVRGAGESSTTKVGRGTAGREPPPTSPLSGAMETPQASPQAASSRAAKAAAFFSRSGCLAPSMDRVGMRPAARAGSL